MKPLIILLVLFPLASHAKGKQFPRCSPQVEAKVSCTTDTDCIIKSQKIANKYQCYFPAVIGIDETRPETSL